METTSVPRGCGPSVDPLYFNLCDLEAVWGVVVEAFAAAGVVLSCILLVVLLASMPFLTDRNRKSMLSLQATFLVFTSGLFGLTFAFIAGRNSVTCAVRRFLFGVLFAGCFACLLMHGLWLVLLDRRAGRPQGWLLWLGALGLWLVEAIINTEWMIITIVRTPAVAALDPNPSCRIANQDFVMALIYVMALMVAVVLMAVPSLTHKYAPFRRDGLYVLLTGILSMGIWVAWIVMYIYGNQVVGSLSWDDPTLAIGLVSNAWVFLILYTIPEICALTMETEELDEPSPEDHLYTSRNAVYENILRDQTQSPQNMYMENRAFAMDEPSMGKIPVSPYSGYDGQLRSCVYQPTEIALITKGLSMVSQRDKPLVTPGLPRGIGPSPTRTREAGAPTGLPPPSSGNGFSQKSQW